MGAIVTGASRGIGLAIARKLEQLGADVATIQRGEGPGISLSADLGRAEAAERAVQEAADRLGRLDICVTQPRCDALRARARRPRRGAAPRSRGQPRRCVRRVAGGRPPLRGAGRWRPDRPHRLDDVGHAGLNTLPYAASKGGLAQLMKAQANEWAPLGIRVNAVAPGWVETELTQPLRDEATRFAEISARIPVGRWAQGDDIAGAVAFLCLPDSEYVNGVVLPVDGGWLAR